MAQPFLRPVGLSLVVPDILLKFLYPLFGRLQFLRKLLRNANRVLDVFFRHTGCPFEQTQYRLAGTFHRIGAVWKQNDGFWRALSHSNNLPHSEPNGVA